jgi:hypothetical protein
MPASSSPSGLATPAKALCVEDGEGALSLIHLPTTGTYAVEVDPSGPDLGQLTVAVALAR